VVDDGERCTHCRALTAADLLRSYLRRFPGDEHPDYDVVIRRMGHVWDCPRDGAVNVVGYRCARCGRTRPGQLEQRQSVEYVRRLCTAFVGGGVEALLPLVPADVAWVPRVGEGRVLRGSDELRGFLADQPGFRAPRPGRIEAVGDHVLVRFQPARPADDPLWSVYLFDEARLFRAVSFASEAEAVRAAV
jgi:hypothetical protein